MLKSMKKRISNNKGLTLIELIIVIAIIGILAVIGISQFGGMTQQAKIAADEAIIEEIESAARLYAAQENLDLPATIDADSDPALTDIIGAGKLVETPDFQSTTYDAKSVSSIEVDVDDVTVTIE